MASSFLPSHIFVHIHDFVCLHFSSQPLSSQPDMLIFVCQSFDCEHFCECFNYCLRYPQTVVVSDFCFVFRFSGRLRKQILGCPGILSVQILIPFPRSGSCLRPRRVSVRTCIFIYMNMNICNFFSLSLPLPHILEQIVFSTQAFKDYSLCSLAKIFDITYLKYCASIFVMCHFYFHRLWRAFVKVAADTLIFNLGRVLHFKSYDSVACFCLGRINVALQAKIAADSKKWSLYIIAICLFKNRKRSVTTHRLTTENRNTMFWRASSIKKRRRSRKFERAADEMLDIFRDRLTTSINKTRFQYRFAMLRWQLLPQDCNDNYTMREIRGGPCSKYDQRHYCIYAVRKGAKSTWFVKACGGKDFCEWLHSWQERGKRYLIILRCSNCDLLAMPLASKYFVLLRSRSHVFPF